MEERRLKVVPLLKAMREKGFSPEERLLILEHLTSLGQERIAKTRETVLEIVQKKPKEKAIEMILDL